MRLDIEGVVSSAVIFVDEIANLEGKREMTKEELATRMNGREYGAEITDQEEAQAKGSSLVAIFGYSDDNVELRGAIDEEISASGGCGFRITKAGQLVPEIDISTGEDDVLIKHGVMEAVLLIQQSACLVSANWCSSAGGYSWIFRTAAPYATFDIMEDGEKFCRGIVIDLKELL